MPDQSATETATPLAASRVVGPLPLMDAENPKSYQELLDHMSSMLEPQNILEEIWIREIAELTWDAFRLRRMKANGLSGAAHRRCKRLLSRCSGRKPRTPRGAGWRGSRQPSKRSRRRLPL